MQRRRLADQPNPQDAELLEELRHNDIEIDATVMTLRSIRAMLRRRAS